MNYYLRCVTFGKRCNISKTYYKSCELKNVLTKSTSKKEHKESDTLLPNYCSQNLGNWNSGAKFTLLSGRLLCQHLDH